MRFSTTALGHLIAPPRHDSPMAGAAIPTLSRRIEDFARKSCRAFPLEELYRLGRGTGQDRLHLARLIHQEVAIRNAQLCKELLLLPFGLAQTQGIGRVVNCFSSYVDWLAAFPVPRQASHDEDFTKLLEQILQDSADVTRSIGTAVLEVKSMLGNSYEEVRPEVDLILDRFFIKRIGLRFLIQHHIEAAKVVPDSSGIIRSDVGVGEILRCAAAEARKAVETELGIAPDVEVVGDGAEIPITHATHASTYATGRSLASSPNLLHNRHVTHVPSHVHFICFELLHNACRAVACQWRRRQLQQQQELLLSIASSALHAGQEDNPPGFVPLGRAAVATLPVAHGMWRAKGAKYGSYGDGPAPVRAIFAHGADEVSIKVSDEGGGIPRSELQTAWSYYTTGTEERFGESEEPLKPLGVGLPLARLHARYYGGDVVLKSMEGFGTDVYVFLNRMGQRCENLPQGVRVSPAQNDSSVGKEASIRLLEALGDMSEADVAFLTRRLHERRLQDRQDAADT